jgi:hypothetical protein
VQTSHSLVAKLDISVVWCLQAALPHLKEGASIINTSSVTSFKGSPSLLDYSSTKGAQVGTADAPSTLCRTGTVSQPSSMLQPCSNAVTKFSILLRHLRAYDSAASCQTVALHQVGALCRDRFRKCSHVVGLSVGLKALLRMWLVLFHRLPSPAPCPTSL